MLTERDERQNLVKNGFSKTHRFYNRIIYYKILYKMKGQTSVSAQGNLGVLPLGENYPILNTIFNTLWQV